MPEGEAFRIKCQLLPERHESLKTWTRFPAALTFWFKRKEEGTLNWARSGQDPIHSEFYNECIVVGP